jgi:hypothetical protein
VAEGWKSRRRAGSRRGMPAVGGAGTVLGVGGEGRGCDSEPAWDPEWVVGRCCCA